MKPSARRRMDHLPFAANASCTPCLIRLVVVSMASEERQTNPLLIGVLIVEQKQASLSTWTRGPKSTVLSLCLFTVVYSRLAYTNKVKRWSMQVSVSEMDGTPFCRMLGEERPPASCRAQGENELGSTSEGGSMQVWLADRGFKGLAVDWDSNCYLKACRLARAQTRAMD
jgi:hypothetical protein